MVYKCCVLRCRRRNERAESKGHVFRFPSDSELRSLWIKAIGRENFEPTKYSRVCDAHFQPTDILRETSCYDEKNGRLLSAPLRVPRLRENAVPCIFPDPLAESPKKINRCQRKMVYCCVPSCNSHKGRREFCNVSFHQIPSKKAMREKWLKVLSRKCVKKAGEWTAKDYSSICSLHFKADDFKEDCQRKVLKSDAVPSIFPGDPSAKEHPSERRQKAKSGMLDDEWSDFGRGSETRMTSCCVPFCCVRSADRDVFGKRIAIYQVPADLDLRRQWEAAIQNFEKSFTLPVDIGYLSVCSLHFGAESYKEDVEDQILKPSAVPTVFEGKVIHRRVKRRIRALLSISGNPESDRTKLNCHLENCIMCQCESESIAEVYVNPEPESTGITSKTALESSDIEGLYEVIEIEASYESGVNIKTENPDHNHTSNSSINQPQVANKTDEERNGEILPDSDFALREQDFSKTCRVCANEKGDTLPIFECEGLSEKIMKHLPIVVTPGDGLPSKVCRTCQRHIDTWQEFVDQSVKADEVLRTRLRKQHMIKQEVNTVSGSELVVADDQSIGLMVDSEDTQLPEVLMMIKAEASNENYTSCAVERDQIPGTRESEENLICIDELQLATVGSILEQSSHTVLLHPQYPKVCPTSSSLFPRRKKIVKSVKGLELQKQNEVTIIKETEVTLKCTQCEETFSEEYLLKAHIEMHEKVAYVTCEFCLKLFNSENALNVHSHIHNTQKPYFFPFCGMQFATKEEFHSHIATHCTDEPYKCRSCGKTFTTYSGLTLHEYFHKWRPMKEEIVTPVEKFHVKKEKVFVKKVWRLPCDVCSKVFDSPYKLKIHKWRHIGYKPFTCNICHMGFGDQSTLRRHTFIHSIYEGKYSCETCGKRFTRKSYLQQHMMKHETTMTTTTTTIKAKYKGSGCFVCDKCGKICQSKMQLDYHSDKHSDVLYPCTICGREYSTKKSLHGHMNYMHKGKIPYLKVPKMCELCGKTFRYRDNFLNHQRMHRNERPYKCNECDAKFTSSGNLRYHLKSHSKERPYMCHICGNSFKRGQTLKSHMVTHSSLKPYACKICSVKFARKGDLSIHLKRHEKTPSLTSVQKPN